MTEEELVQRLAAMTAFAEDAPAIARVAAKWGEEAGVAFARLRAAIHRGELEEAFVACDELLAMMPEDGRTW